LWRIFIVVPTTTPPSKGIACFLLNIIKSLFLDMEIKAKILAAMQLGTDYARVCYSPTSQKSLGIRLKYASCSPNYNAASLNIADAFYAEILRLLDLLVPTDPHSREGYDILDAYRSALCIEEIALRMGKATNVSGYYQRELEGIKNYYGIE
jgi:hypothetical protein